MIFFQKNPKFFKNIFFYTKKSFFFSILGLRNSTRAFLWSQFSRVPGQEYDPALPLDRTDRLGTGYIGHCESEEVPWLQGEAALQTHSFRDADPQLAIPSNEKEFPRASPLGTPSGGGVFLTVYPSSRPNTDTVSLCVLFYICYIPTLFPLQD